MTDPFTQEILRLHRFFEDWFTGRLPDTEDGFSPLIAALAPDFTLISPDGRLAKRDQLLAIIRHRHGSLPDFQIAIAGVTLRHAAGSWAMVTYEEWQTRDGQMDGRLSSVLFHTPAANRRPLWLHVHETWLPQRPEAVQPG